MLSEARLVKDEWEIAELQSACDITTLGFEDSVREWDRVLEHGERWVEGTFFRRARTMGNDIGYDSIVGGGRHATTLHWIENSGSVTPGDLVLLDMGAEATSLYTADVTRTLPVDGTFTPLQRDLYSLVLEAQQAGVDAVRPGAAFRAAHEVAMSILVRGLDDLGILPVSQDEALSPDSRIYARWTLHGTSHMLGLDVHDCAVADTGIYPGGDARGGHGAHRRAGSVLPGGRPARPGGAPRHRDPDRGRRRGHGRRRTQPVRGAAARTRRDRGLDGAPPRLTVRFARFGGQQAGPTAC